MRMTVRAFVNLATANGLASAEDLREYELVWNRKVAPGSEMLHSYEDWAFDFKFFQAEEQAVTHET